MSLATKLFSLVPPESQARGVPLFRQGMAGIVDSTERHVEAVIEAEDRRSVALWLEGNTLHHCCSCSRDKPSRGACEHVWATILAADAEGSLRAARRQARLGFLPAVSFDPEELLEFDKEEDFDEEDDLGLEEGGEEGDGSRNFGNLVRAIAGLGPARWRPKAAPRPSWKTTLSRVESAMADEDEPGSSCWPGMQEIAYVIDTDPPEEDEGLALEIVFRERKTSGAWGKWKPHRNIAARAGTLLDPKDRRIVSLLQGSAEKEVQWHAHYREPYSSSGNRFRLLPGAQETLLPLLCETGRCMLRSPDSRGDLQPIRWEGGKPWTFWLEVRHQKDGRAYLLEGSLRREASRLPLSTPKLLVAGGLVFITDHAAPLEDSGAFAWIGLLRHGGLPPVPAKEGHRFVEKLTRAAHLPPLELPEEIRFEEVRVEPVFCLRVRRPPEHRAVRNRLLADLFFDYDGETVEAEARGRGCYQAKQRRLLLRDLAAERRAAARLAALGLRPSRSPWSEGLELELLPRSLPRVARELVAEGWRVEADGKVLRRPGAIRIEVTSGIDWFELEGGVDFDGAAQAPLPELLAALRRGQDTVRLDDGTYGMLPQEWLRRYAPLAGLGEAQDGRLRFRKSQVGLLDALLAAMPEATCDETFARAREELHSFRGIRPAQATGGFTGRLRGYQREGLGWIHFLRHFGFGGCLADDMGLGKTVQVLALLEARRELHASPGTAQRPPASLIVVPRSLIFNWKQEARRFTPALRVSDYTGPDRSLEGLEDHDVLLTTYGTVRRDAAQLHEIRFDYVILDEAQAAKNASTATAKAVRLLQGDHRLALSGTPIENHLGELWSLFEFLNPGMLGRAGAFRALASAGGRPADEELREMLARALRPFLLRRTKEQVAPELPARIEQTVTCDFEPPQKRLYDELREHYRRSLLRRIDRSGMKRVKIQVLEALLRLRQAACHPGLIDPARREESSAKLDALLPRLSQVVEEGHKALVFSQFTSFLAIVRERLDRNKIPYAYLDGRTRNRRAQVERFQTDPDCRLFLISLKAGGLGLNLTAAEYVFLLDPWWNPAAEAQAIDRTHRIGQSRRVVAYRLIARDTVEEKVLELQRTKKALADAIVRADGNLLKTLSREDLERLLS